MRRASNMATLCTVIARMTALTGASQDNVKYAYAALGKTVERLSRFYAPAVDSEPPPSAWDPEAGALEAFDVVGASVIEGHVVRALMLEIVRRAVYDYVLYRSSSRLDQKELAHSAHVWLFEEGPGHPWWACRQKEDREFTSFLSICECLDIDPDVLREHVRKATPQQVLMVRSPNDRRRATPQEDDVFTSECGVHVDFTFED